MDQQTGQGAAALHLVRTGSAGRQRRAASSQRSPCGGAATVDQTRQRSKHGRPLRQQQEQRHEQADETGRNQAVLAVHAHLMAGMRIGRRFGSGAGLSLIPIVMRVMARMRVGIRHGVMRRMRIGCRRGLHDGRVHRRQCPADHGRHDHQRNRQQGPCMKPAVEEGRTHRPDGKACLSGFPAKMPGSCSIATVCRSLALGSVASGVAHGLAPRPALHIDNSPNRTLISYMGLHLSPVVCVGRAGRSQDSQPPAAQRRLQHAIQESTT